MPTSAVSSDRNLLFGLLALQLDFVTRDQLLEAMNAWMLEQYTPLGELLVRRGVLEEDDRADVEKLLGKHVKRHGDVRASIAAVLLDGDVRASLAALDDADVSASLPRQTPPDEDEAPVTAPRRPPRPRCRCATTGCARWARAGWVRCTSRVTRSWGARWR